LNLDHAIMITRSPKERRFNLLGHAADCRVKQKQEESHQEQESIFETQKGTKSGKNQTPHTSSSQLKWTKKV